MRGITEETLLKLQRETSCKDDAVSAFDSCLEACEELQGKWMTLGEFLKSGFVGWCWIIDLTGNHIEMAYYDEYDVFSSSAGLIVYDKDYITHVIPIHKPEPPK